MSLTQAHEPHTAEAVAEELPERLRETLGLLHAVEDDVAELTLAALPFGSRVALSGYGIVETSTRAPAEPAEVSLTRFGREVIAVCALLDAPPEVRNRIDALAEARAQRTGGRDVTRDVRSRGHGR
jgi:hypothetical protein